VTLAKVKSIFGKKYSMLILILAQFSANFKISEKQYHCNVNVAVIIIEILLSLDKRIIICQWSSNICQIEKGSNETEICSLHADRRARVGWSGRKYFAIFTRISITKVECELAENLEVFFINLATDLFFSSLNFG